MGKEAELFKKYQCFCNSGKDNLQKAISELKVKSPQIASSLWEGKSSLDRLTSELRAAKDEKLSTKRRMEEAQALRDKQTKAYTEQAEKDSLTIRAIKKAIEA